MEILAKEEVQLQLGLEDPETYGPWVRTHNCDPAGRSLADRHYSRQTVGAARFTRPGKNLVLRTPEGDAIWASWYSPYRLDRLKACECTIFRNESKHTSSYLIAMACLVTFHHFESEGLEEAISDGIITYVDETKVESKNPGFSFQSIGFKRIGRTKKNNLLIYQLKKEDLLEYLNITERREAYKAYFDHCLEEAYRVIQETDDIYDGIEIFVDAMREKKHLLDLYKYAKKMKFHIPGKRELEREFELGPDLQEFLLTVYGGWYPIEEYEYWEATVKELL